MNTTVTVPLLDLDAQYRPLREELLAAVTRVCDSGRFILGPEVDALEHELERALGVAHAVTVSSGQAKNVTSPSRTVLVHAPRAAR